VGTRRLGRSRERRLGPIIDQRENFFIYVGMLALTFLVIAGLFAAVGQAGATGYLATMGWAGFDPHIMRPVALGLNVTVALIGTIQFARAKRFSWRLFYPFGVFGFPFSILGGALSLPRSIYNPVVALLLLLASAQLARQALIGKQVGGSERDPPFLLALISGGAVGFVSGLTGTGGGIFLAPILLLTGWVTGPRAAAVCAAYNLLNSFAALAAIIPSGTRFPPQFPYWLGAVAIGGAIGSTFGARYLPERGLRALLALILFASAAKFLWG